MLIHLSSHQLALSPTIHMHLFQTKMPHNKNFLLVCTLSNSKFYVLFNHPSSSTVSIVP